MKNLKLPIVIQKDPDTGLFVGFVPGTAGLHSQAESIEELKLNLKEVINLYAEEGEPIIIPEYIGTEILEVTI